MFRVSAAPIAPPQFSAPSHYARPRSRAATSEPSVHLWTAIITVLAVVAFDLAAIEGLQNGAAAAFSRENGPFETVQLLLMVPTFLLFWTAARNGTGTVQAAGGLLAFVVLAAFIRELEFKSFLEPVSRFEFFVAYRLRDVLMTVAALAGLVYFWRHRRCVPSLVRLALKPQSWPFAVGIGLLLFAELYVDDIPGVTGRFWEEITETHGYLLLAVAAWRHAFLIGDASHDFAAAKR